MALSSGAGVVPLYSGVRGRTRSALGLGLFSPSVSSLWWEAMDRRRACSTERAMVVRSVEPGLVQV